MRTDISLVYRYLKMREPVPEETARLVFSIAENAERQIDPGYAYRVFPLLEEAEGFRLAGTDTVLSGRSVKKLLSGCDRAAVLTATLGFGFERLLAAGEKRDMAEAVILDACGSSLIESVADEAEEEIQTRTGAFLTDRFSPGYGDMPLSLQPAFLSLTGAENRLGVHAESSFLMTPSKTVTAVIGLSDSPRPAYVRGCRFCTMKNCSFRTLSGGCRA